MGSAETVLLKWFFAVFHIENANTFKKQDDFPVKCILYYSIYHK